LVDDHPLFLEDLQYFLGTHGVRIAGTARNGWEALEKVRALKPDIIIMDIRMPECDGLDALRLIKAEMPDIKIVMLTTSEEDEDLLNAVKYGASGYLLKNADASEIMNMLTSLENNEVPLSQGLAAKLLKEFKKESGSEAKHPQPEHENNEEEKLTKRQLEVLEMVARGVTYREAGEALGLTERTVKYHMGRILELLHLENRAQVIAYASRIGLVGGDKRNQ
jgi:two-component system NarL family response regulator